LEDEAQRRADWYRAGMVRGFAVLAAEQKAAIKAGVARGRTRHASAISTKLPKKTLDEALRYLYAAIVYLEAPIVAIRFEFNGETWEADTVDEAIALRAKLEYSTRFPPDPHKEIGEQAHFWTLDKFVDAINGIGKLQHQFLRAIWEKNGVSSSELIEQLGLSSEVALAGVISGLSKQLKQLNIEPNRVFRIEVKWTGKKKSRTFFLAEFFISAGVEHNWPEAWTAKLKGEEA
jgi:hypothetical protein